MESDTQQMANKGGDSSYYSAIGGSLGAFIAMQMFRHKTKKWYFKYTVPAMLVVHVVGMILLVVKL